MRQAWYLTVPEKRKCSKENKMKKKKKPKYLDGRVSKGHRSQPEEIPMSKVRII